MHIVFFGDGSGVSNANTIPPHETFIAPSLKGCVQLYEIFGLDPILAIFVKGIRSLKALVWLFFNLPSKFKQSVERTVRSYF